MRIAPWVMPAARRCASVSRPCVVLDGWVIAVFVSPRLAVIDATRVCSITANLGDTKTAITHPSSTTHGRLTEAQRLAAGITQGTIRIAVGLEDLEDLKADLARGLDTIK